MIGFGEDIPDKRCSRAGCTEAAHFNVNWRNPKIHGLDRVKVWLACDEHRDFLREFLLARSFPVVVTAINESVSVVPDGAGA